MIKNKDDIAETLKLDLSDKERNLVQLYIDKVRSKVKPASDEVKDRVFFSYIGTGIHNRASKYIRNLWYQAGYPGHFTLTAAKKVLETGPVSSDESTSDSASL